MHSLRFTPIVIPKGKFFRILRSYYTIPELKDEIYILTTKNKEGIKS